MAVKKRIDVNQGADFTEHVLIVDGLEIPIDMVADGFTSRMHVKRSWKDDAPIIFELTTENGGILLHEGGIIGRITLVLTDTQTEILAIRGPVLDCIYDWELVDGTGYVRRIYEGDFIIAKNLTV